MKKIKVGAVSYLNTKPLLYGIEKSDVLMQQIELIKDYPSKIAKQLIDGDIDVGLVPVAILPQLKESYIISDYCIGCDGEVASVCLFSEVPLNEIEKVLLDYQSLTSIDLLKILITQYWKINPVLEETTGEYQSKISGTTAALIIGDRALEQRKISSYIFDLGYEWKKFTELPFVFAAWVSNKKLPMNFVSLFNDANRNGVMHIDKVINSSPTSIFDLRKYYSDHINYHLDADKREGMNLFLEKIKNPAMAG